MMEWAVDVFLLIFKPIIGSAKELKSEIRSVQKKSSFICKADFKSRRDGKFRDRTIFLRHKTQCKQSSCFDR